MQHHLARPRLERSLADDSGDLEAPQAAWACPPDRRETLARLYRAHAAQVLRWAARLGGPYVDAEDVLQEVFYAAFHDLDRFEGRSRVSTWLFSITRNVVYDRLNRDAHRRTLLGRHAATAEAHTSPVADLERRSCLELAYRVLGELPEIYRTALVLVDIDGLSAEAAGEIAGVNVNTLRVRLMRARAKFAERFARFKPEA